MEPHVSVIVAVFNAEKWLPRCLDSLVSQTLESLEILLIDDGSTDSPGHICEEYARKDCRIRVIHQTNKGVSATRQVGITHSTGDYFIFIAETTSSLAMIPIDIEKDNIDFCMSSAQKGIMAMFGLSFIIGNRAIIEASADYPKRSYYCNLYLQFSYFEKTGEMHFTPPVQTVYAAVQALKEYFEEGEQAKWERHLRVNKAMPFTKVSPVWV